MGDAVFISTYLINRMPNHVLSCETSLHKIKNCFPTYHFISNLPLKVFGGTVFIHIHSHSQSKLDPGALKCVFIGYTPTEKGYKYYDPLGS